MCAKHPKEECPILYRKFGRHSIEVSQLGFGMMRLPVIDNDQAKIDEKATREMVEYAVAHGVNYIDTAWPYHREQSEPVVGRILKGGLRDKVYLATKNPVWLVNSREDFDKYLGEQLTKLQTDRIDMYLLHALGKERWSKLLEYNFADFLDRAKADGRIRYAGFSFHDDLATFKTIVDAYDWDFCQIQYNFMDEQFQAGTEGLKYAAAKGMAVVIMEPLRGGRLVRNVHPDVQAIWDRTGTRRKPADWALRWVWNHPEVTLLLSGMGELSQVIENVATAETATPGGLNAAELQAFEEIKAFYRARTMVACTQCEYCQPCPQKIVIPHYFGTWNDAAMYGLRADYAKNYERMKQNFGDPAACAECGQCEEACPQHLPIRKHLKELHAYFSGE